MLKLVDDRRVGIFGERNERLTRDIQIHRTKRIPTVDREIGSEIEDGHRPGFELARTNQTTIRVQIEIRTTLQLERNQEGIIANRFGRTDLIATRHQLYKGQARLAGP